MKTRNKDKKRNYMYLSITLLILAIYVISFPFVSKILEKISLELVVCPYLKMTGNPCPLCGGTRYFAGLGNVFQDIRYLFHPFGIMAIGVIFEIIFRIYVIWKIKKDRITKGVVIFDIIMHSIMIISFILYEVFFFLK